jgi:hypothetical protein
MRDEIWLGRQSAVLPGQLWLAEQPPGEALFPIDCEAIADTNVVIYERSLADRVAEILALGAYAEPMPTAAGRTPPAISPRALQFATEGWSVVQLVERRPARLARWGGAAEALHGAGFRGDLPVTAIAKPAGGPGRRDQATLGELDTLLGGAGDDFLTLVFGPLAHLPAGRSNLFTALGLAG